MTEETYPALSGCFAALLTVMECPINHLKDEIHNLIQRIETNDPITMSYIDNIDKYIGQIEMLQQEGVEKWQKFHN